MSTYLYSSPTTDLLWSWSHSCAPRSPSLCCLRSLRLPRRQFVHISVWFAWQPLWSCPLRQGGKGTVWQLDHTNEKWKRLTEIYKTLSWWQTVKIMQICRLLGKMQVHTERRCCLMKFFKWFFHSFMIFISALRLPVISRSSVHSPHGLKCMYVAKQNESISVRMNISSHLNYFSISGAEQTAERNQCSLPIITFSAGITRKQRTRLTRFSIK